MKNFFMLLFAVILLTALTNAQDAPHSVGLAPADNVTQPQISSPNDFAVGTRAFTQLSTSPTFQFGKLFMESCTPTNIGAAFTITFPGGLVERNGVIYTWNQSSPFQLWSIDTVTGTHTLVFNMTGVPMANYTGMCWDGTTMYGISTSITQSQIHTVNMTTGACTPIGTASSTCAGAISLMGVRNAAASLFVLDIVADNSYKVNKTTGVFTLVGSLTQLINFGQDGGVDPNDNKFYCMAYTTAAQLRVLDTTTGALGPILCSYTAQATGIALMGVQSGPVTCNYSWTNQTSGTTSLLYSVKTVSDLIGWAAGAAGTVRRTTDGGTTWTNANPNPGVINGDIYNIEALDANTAWVTTSPSATFIYKTTNGGTNWTQVYTLAGAFLNAIKMVSATNGYAFGDPVGGNWLLLRTTDGGSTWTSLATIAGTGDGRNNCVQVSLPNMWFGTGQGTIWRSTNSGANWVSVTTTGLTGQVLGVRFNNANTGLGGGATMVKSTDGGASYTLLTASGTGNITGIQGNGNDFWYTRGTGIYRSTDNGTTWTSSHTHTATQNDISLVTGSNGCMTGWSCGASGTIAKMTGTPVGINDPTNNLPSNYSLEQNYPNPFNPSTSITFSMPKAGNVELKVYDMIGREVALITAGSYFAGTHTVLFDASSLASGVYFYKLTSGDFTDSKKMVLIK